MKHLVIVLVAWGAIVASTRAADPPAGDAKTLVANVIKAGGGQDKLLGIFRIKEEFSHSPEPLPKEKRSSRTSILEAPKYWWVNNKDRSDEQPAKNVVWAWTLGVFIDPKTKVEVIPDIMENNRPAFGLRVSETVKTAIDLYFDKETNLLVRLDDRQDFYRFSDWKEHDGAKYPAKSIIFKKANGKAWFHHEIVEIERLKERPDGLNPKP
jgi:hypothetical protein